MTSSVALVMICVAVDAFRAPQPARIRKAFIAVADFTLSQMAKHPHDAF